MVNWEAYSVKSLDLWSEKVSEELEACTYPAPLEVSYIKWIRNKCLHSCGYNQVRGSAAALSAELCKERRKKNPNSNSLLSCFQEPATRTECLWASSVQSAAEKRGGGWRWRDRKDVSSSFRFLFFWLLAGTVSDPICFQLPVEDDVSPLPVRYVLHMQTPKHPGVSPLSSHLAFPSVPPLLCSIFLPSSTKNKWFIFIVAEGKMATGSFPLFLSLTLICW